MDTPDIATPKSRSKEVNGDLFGDEDAMGGLLKSLINPTGLQSAWRRIAKRLQVTEKGLKTAQERLDTLPVDYVTRSEYSDVVMRKHEENFEEHGNAIRRLDEITSNTLETVFKEQGKLQDCLERTEVLERWRSETSPIIAGVEARAEALALSVRAEFDAARKALKDQTNKSNIEFAELKGQVKGGLDSIAVELKALEARMKEFTTGEVQRVTNELMAWDPLGHNGPSPQQAGMLAFVENATAAIKSDLTHTTDKLQKLSTECARHREETYTKFRVADKATVDVSLKLRDMSEALETDLQTRANKEDVLAFQADLTTRMTSLVEGSTELKSQVVTKLNEFCDHFKKIQDAMDDHEHCLRHHAEEIENRASKYDILICQTQLDKSAKREEVLRETQELRQLLNWQSGKIESFSLFTSGMAIGKASFRGSTRKNKRLSRTGTSTSVSSLEASMLQVPEERGEGSRATSGAVSKTPSMLSRSGSKDMSAGGEKAQASDAAALADDKQATSLSVWSEGANTSTQVGDSQDYYDDESEEESDDAAVGGASIIKQQLQAVTMALVGLGHLLLREQKLGQTRDARLRQERDMLQELQNLRYWVTNRIAPAGWDPAKITTMALACAHPREDELKRPMPQVSLKGIMQPEELPGLVRRLPHPSEEKEVSLPTAPRSARGGLRPRTGTTTSALVTDHLSKAPLSARGAGGGCAGSLLPRLQGLALAA